MNRAVRVLKPLMIALSITVCIRSAPAGQTPETRTLTAEQAAQTLQRDWLFQAMGQPLSTRAEMEIGWARQLADRLTRNRPAPDLSAELGELDRLEGRWHLPKSFISHLRYRPVHKILSDIRRLPIGKRKENSVGCPQTP